MTTSKNKIGVLFLISMGICLSNYLLCGPSYRQDNERIIDWDRVRITFEAYLRAPSPENAQLLLEAIPGEETESETGDKSGAVRYIHDSYLEFEARVLAGDRCLTEAAFRLLDFSDAAFSEALDQMLGNLAGERPRPYLQFLFKYRNTRYVKHIGPPILVTKSDEPQEKVVEWKKRIKALKSIREPKYRQLRDECIRQLNEAIKDASGNAGSLSGTSVLCG